MVNGRVLFLSAHAPTCKYPQAGQKIAFHNLREYAKVSEEVDIFVIANQAEIIAATDLLEEFSDNLYLFPLTKINKISSCLTRFQLPLKFASRWQSEAANKLKDLLLNNTYDIIHFEYSHAAVYLDLIRSLTNSQSTTVISIHDIVAQSFLRKATSQPLLGIEAARIFNYEGKIYSTANNLWVLSPKDKDILTSLFALPEEKITVKPPQVSDFVYQVQRQPHKIEPKSLLFWAAMNRPENEEAILLFVERCFQKLLQQDAEFKLYIVGANPSAKVKYLKSENIIVTGFIEDPTEYFERAAMGITPLQTGAGVKLKTLEMLEAGLDVISTRVGAEGVEPRRELLVSDDFDEWLKLITKFFKH